MVKKRQKSEGLIGFYLRIPASLKEKIDQESKKKSCSQAQIVVDLIESGLAKPESFVSEDVARFLR